jgi:hypothetical protein
VDTQVEVAEHVLSESIVVRARATPDRVTPDQACAHIFGACNLEFSVELHNAQVGLDIRRIPYFELSDFSELLTPLDQG